METRSYKTHKEVPLKLDLNLEKAMVIAITVMLTFVIPAQAFTYFSKQENQSTEVIQAAETTGQENIGAPSVAGESTSRAIYESTNDSTGFQMNSESAPFFILGGIFIVSAVAILAILLKSEQKLKAKPVRDEFAEQFDI